MSFISSIPDFLNRPFDLGSRPEAFKKIHADLNTMAHTPHWLMVNDKGNFVETQLGGRVWEWFRAAFGCNDHASREIVGLRFTQLIAQAAEEGLLVKEDCQGSNSLIHQIAKKVGIIPNTQHFSLALHDLTILFDTIVQSIANPQAAKPDFKHLIRTFCETHAEQLAPHTLLGRIRNVWKKQQEPSIAFIPNESQSFEKKFSDVKTDQTPIIVTPQKKNPDSLDLLSKLAEIEMPSEFSKDHYLRFLLADNPDEKMIFTWISEVLAPSGDEKQQIIRIDRVIPLLDFKNQFALLAGFYRICLTNHWSFMALAMAARLEKLIDEHSEDYQLLDLTDLSPTSKTFRLNLSVLPHQLFYELMEQRLNSQRIKIPVWLGIAGVGLLTAIGISIAGNVYAVKKLTIDPPPPLSPLLINHVANPLYGVIGALLLANLGGSFVLISRHRKSQRKRKEAEEAARLVQEAQRKAEEVVRLEQEEAKRKEAEEAARLEQEAKRKEAEEAARLVQEAQRKAEEAVRLEQEAKRKEAEEAARLVQEAKRKEAEEAARLVQEAQRKEAEEAARLEQEAKRKEAERKQYFDIRLKRLKNSHESLKTILVFIAKEILNSNNLKGSNKIQQIIDTIDKEIDKDNVEKSEQSFYQIMKDIKNAIPSSAKPALEQKNETNGSSPSLSNPIPEDLKSLEKEILQEEEQIAFTKRLINIKESSDSLSSILEFLKKFISSDDSYMMEKIKVSTDNVQAILKTLPHYATEEAPIEKDQMESIEKRFHKEISNIQKIIDRINLPTLDEEMEQTRDILHGLSSPQGTPRRLIKALTTS